MESVFAVCDVFFVSRLGDDAVAVVGLTEAMLTIVYAIAIGLSMGATAMVARRIGEQNRDGAVRAATGAVASGVLVGLVLGIPCLFFAPTLLGWMGASAAVVEAGRGYSTVMLGGNVVITLLFLNNAVLRGAGDAALAMRALWIANAINLVLDPCLIFGLGPFPELGVTGAAVATTIGRGTGVLYQMAMLRRGVGRLALRGPAFRLRPPVVLELLRLSAGGVMQFLIATASWIVLMRIVSPFGDAAVAGYTIAIRIVMFAILPSWGLSNAAATLVGQNLGAGAPDRAEKSVWYAARLNMALMTTVALAFIIFARPLVSVFLIDAAAVAVGVACLRLLSLGNPLYAWGMVLAQAFNGAGDTRTPLRLNVICFWLLQLPLAWWLARHTGLGVKGVFLGVVLAELALTVLGAQLFRQGEWKTREI
ncbi:MAG: MATE family efflux transporter, partial [Planctomycetes bacterium]|nr:MATE family efflux transporter [Planctomycetota bacterium]